MANLRFDLKDLLVWFTVNSLKNRGKFHLAVFLYYRVKITRTSEVVLLGITTDDQLTFKTHIGCIFPVTRYTMRALQRLRNYLNTEKLGYSRLLATAFING